MAGSFSSSRKDKADRTAQKRAACYRAPAVARQPGHMGELGVLLGEVPGKVGAVSRIQNGGSRDHGNHLPIRRLGFLLSVGKSRTQTARSPSVVFSRRAFRARSVDAPSKAVVLFSVLGLAHGYPVLSQFRRAMPVPLGKCRPAETLKPQAPIRICAIRRRWSSGAVVGKFGGRGRMLWGLFRLLRH